MENIIYTFGNKAYLNITNACPCNCDFCVRRNADGLGDMGSLWLEHEPSLEEIFEAVDKFDWSGYDTAVFCGFGEPTCALDKLLKTAEYIKKKCGVKIRLNTNGLSDLINKTDDSAKMMAGLIDCVSVSLNASDEAKYDAVVHSKYGKASFEAMLRFARNARRYIPEVRMTVVDCIGEEEIEKCRALCEKNGVALRVRTYIK